MGENNDQRWWNSRFKFANGAVAKVVKSSLPYVNDSDMSVRAIISTPTVDRVGDLLIPSGIKLDNYRKNPVVYWGHGLEGIVLPIGKSEDEDKKLTVEITDNAVYATCFFAQDFKEAAQIFSLIKQGIVRATSVRETPITQRTVVIDGKRVNRVDECDLEEWSFAGVGVNPDAITKAINQRYDGHQLSRAICKSLNAAMPAKRPFGKGCEMKTDQDDDDREDDDVGGQGVASDKPADEVADRDGDDDGKPVAEVETSDPTQDPESDTLYGRQLIGTTHDAVKCLMKSINDSMKNLDNPPLKEKFESLHDDLGAHVPTLHGMRDEHYPDSSELKDENADDEEGSEDGGDEGGEQSDSAMKSMFASLKSSAKLTAKGIHSILSSVSKSRHVPENERSKLRSAASAMKSLLAQAEQFKPAVQIAVESKPKIDEDAAARLRKALS